MRKTTVIAFLCLSTPSVVLFAEETSSQLASFVIRSYRGGPTEPEFLSQCESLRSQIEERWLGKTSREPWSPRCEVVLHATRSSYLQAVGRGGAQSYGSSLVRADGERIVRRRIDLLANHHQQFTALTHELTHVVLVERFKGGQPPLWADEGIATLADSTTKQSLHRRDCLAALRNGTSFRLMDLMRLERFTSPHQVAAFYGQSLMLVQFLVQHDEPSKLVAFLEKAEQQGYDRALRESYEIDGVAHLESLWRDYTVSGIKTNASAQDAAGG